MYNDITKVAQMAWLHKNADPNVIDATSGVYFDENMQVGYSKTFDKIASSLAPTKKYIYGNVSGGHEFQDNVARWLFRDIKFSEPPVTFATMGATGALSNALDIYGKTGNSILTTELCWHNYELMAQTHHMKLVTFPLTNDTGFNVSDFIKEVKNIIEQEESLIFILNQPAHNPTGFTLKEEEMKNILDILGSIKRQVVLIYDIAYLDLARENSHFNLISQASSNIKVILAYSFSKSLGLYGLRLGATVLINGSEEDRDYFFQQNYLLSRTKWNSPNLEAINTFNQIMRSKETEDQVINEISDMKKTLKQRSSIFIRFLDEMTIPYYSYNDGFFITIKSNDPNKLFEDFKSQLIYPVVVNNGVRFSIASLPIPKIKELCSRIKIIFEN